MNSRPPFFEWPAKEKQFEAWEWNSKQRRLSEWEEGAHMNRETSFREKLDSGWSMAQLMDYYAMTDREYDRVIACLAELKKKGGRL